MTFTTLTAEQLKANDQHHLRLIKMKCPFYMWKDLGNMYDCSSGRSIKPADMKGFVELVGHSSKDFARLFIELPDVIDLGGVKIIGHEGMDKEKWLERVWSL